MQNSDFFRIICEDIHSTIIATTDNNGLPVTCVIDMALAVCPQKCIDSTKQPFKINQNNCLHCGNCFRDCPVDAVMKRG